MIRQGETDAFLVVHRPYTMSEAVEEAKRCLNCKVPSSRKECPINNNIPDFIHQLSRGNMGAAMDILNETSNLPAICGRVCPHEKQCQGHCVPEKKGTLIHIDRPEAFVADFDTEMRLTPEKMPHRA